MAEVALGVDGARIDGKARALGGKTRPAFVQAQVVAHDVEQVRRVLSIVDGELRLESEVGGVFAQQTRTDAVEGAGPMERVDDRAGRGAHHLRGDALDAPGHLGRGAAREGHQQDAARVGTGDDEVRHAMGEGVGLARAGTRDDEQRATCGATADAVLHSLPLLRIQTGEIVDLFGEHGSNHGLSGVGARQLILVLFAMF